MTSVGQHWKPRIDAVRRALASKFPFTIAMLTPGQTLGYTGNCEALLLHCIDYRFITATTTSAEQLGLANVYDDSIVPGASLGVNVDADYEAGFIKTLELALTLHHIKELVVIEHQDCGFYKGQYGPLTPEQERLKHYYNVRKFAKRMAQSGIPIRGFLLSLDHKLEPIPIIPECQGNLDQLSQSPIPPTSLQNSLILLEPHVYAFLIFILYLFLKNFVLS